MGDNRRGLKQKQERLGEVQKNNFGTEMKIVEYKDCYNIVVEFQDEYKANVHSRYSNFKSGSIKNPYDKEVFGIGYYGQGKYKPKIKEKNEKKIEMYKVWIQMLRRCYDAYFINNNHLTYIDCFVCDEWHNFQNFAK